MSIIDDHQAKCEECGILRQECDVDYHPFQLLFGGEIGWYSGDDTTLCGPCMAKIFGEANK